MNLKRCVERIKEHTKKTQRNKLYITFFDGQAPYDVGMPVIFVHAFHEQDLVGAWIFDRSAIYEYSKISAINFHNSNSFISFEMSGNVARLHQFAYNLIRDVFHRHVYTSPSLDPIEPITNINLDVLDAAEKIAKQFLRKVEEYHHRQIELLDRAEAHSWRRSGFYQSSINIYRLHKLATDMRGELLFARTLCENTPSCQQYVGAIDNSLLSLENLHERLKRFAFTISLRIGWKVSALTGLMLFFLVYQVMTSALPVIPGFHGFVSRFWPESISSGDLVADTQFQAVVLSALICAVIAMIVAVARPRKKSFLA